MIFDTLDHWRGYGWKGERFLRAFKYLETLSPDTPDGRYELEGDMLYCMLQGYETRPREGQQFEAHRAYVDIQCMLSGEESIFWAPTLELATATPYVPDIEFFTLTPNPTELVLTPGRFCVFFPQDAHAPCTTHTAVSQVRKAVVKVGLG